MSTLNNTGARFVGWVQRRAVLLVAGAVTLALVITIFVTTFRLYDARQERDAERDSRVAAVERLATENRRLAAENVEQNRQQCEGINASNETLRFLLDGAIRGRTPTSPPLTDSARQLTLDTYRRLPTTDCATGTKTYFDPPFPP